jgi:hypothetical protein
MDGLYEILGFMSGDGHITTLGLLAVSDMCRDELLKQYPFLAEIPEPEFDIDTYGVESIWTWVAEQEAKYGTMLNVEPLVPGSFTRENDLEVIERVRGNTDNVIPIII